jgi:hypothetical protein
MAVTRAPSRLKDALIWIGFAGAIVIATAPVWQRLALGFNPTLGEVLAIVACSAPK